MRPIYKHRTELKITPFIIIFLPNLSSDLKDQNHVTLVLLTS